MKAFRHIWFREKDHKYFTLDGKDYVSVTTHIGNTIVPKFKEHYWLAFCVMKEFGKPRSDKARGVPEGMIEMDGSLWEPDHIHDKYPLKIQQLSKEWTDESDKGTTRGTILHNYLENLARNKILDLPEEYLDYKAPMDDFMKGRHIPYPELIVGDDELGIAGQIDAPDDKWIIWDYKFDKEIEFDNRWEKFKYPFHDMDACSFNKYIVQVNSYQYLIEKNSDVSITGKYVVHFTPGNYTIYEVPDIQHRMNSLFGVNDFKLNMV